jgi:hypothetical protein
MNNENRDNTHALPLVDLAGQWRPAYRVDYMVVIIRAFLTGFFSDFLPAVQFN